MYRLITQFRGAMVVLIYQHTLGIQDGLYDDSAAVTLMSTDVDNIANILVTLNECWAEVIEVTVGIYLLARQVGWVSIMPIVIVAGMVETSLTDLITNKTSFDIWGVANYETNWWSSKSLGGCSPKAYCNHKLNVG